MSEMKYRCVSYPDFEPDHTWLRQMLLFTDEIHRIIPRNENPKDSYHLKQLMEHCEGAVTISRPESYLEVTEDQARLFAKALDQPEMQAMAAVGDGHLNRQSRDDWEELHIEKLDRRLRELLRQRNMLRDPGSRRGPDWSSAWRLVPKGVGGMVVGMIANKIATKEGFDAITDLPMAFALNTAQACQRRSTKMFNGVIASAIATVHVPSDIGHMPIEEYAQLRERSEDARLEFATMVREFREMQSIDEEIDADQLNQRLMGIVGKVGTELKKFRKARSKSKRDDWVPLALTTIFPFVAQHFMGKEMLSYATTGFGVTIKAVGIMTKKTAQFSHPKVLSTLCKVDAAIAKDALQRFW